MNKDEHEIENLLSLATEALTWTKPRGRLDQIIHGSQRFLRDGVGKDYECVKELEEISYIYRLWKPGISHYDGLRDKIGRAFTKGILLREKETPWGNNAPRNDLFTYSLAGRLLKGKVNVLAVNGCPRNDVIWWSPRDLSISLSHFLIDVECKRPQTEANIYSSIEEAQYQLTATLPPEMLGVIAVDASCTCRDEKEFIHRLAGRDFDTALSLFIVDLIPTDLAKQLPQNILGILLDFTYPMINYAAVIDERQPDGTVKPTPRYRQTTYRRPTFYPNIRCSHQQVNQMLINGLALALSQ